MHSKRTNEDTGYTQRQRPQSEQKTWMKKYRHCRQVCAEGRAQPGLGHELSASSRNYPHLAETTRILQQVLLGGYQKHIRESSAARPREVSPSVEGV